MIAMNNTRILAENVSVSNDTKATGLNNNDMIIGSSGSGKTGGYVIPNKTFYVFLFRQLRLSGFYRGLQNQISLSAHISA